MPNLDIPPKTWLEELFDCSFCCECGGDENHHTAVPFMGNWFARCDYPQSFKEEKYHPVIAKYRKEFDKKNKKGS